jgi:iron complex outermembrane receptor protein
LADYLIGSKKKVKCFKLWLSFIAGLMVVNANTASSSDGIITEEDLFAEIDFVSGVTHLKQDLKQVPAAVTIIDRRTIESSTAVDLVDLFRLVPGFQVYFFHGNKPSVTYHIHGGQYSRRLEVKIDGRSVYEPLLSSVEWNTLGVELDDIEYIEVVRGSNSAADGSNAFIASINIVTRSPLADLGTKVSVKTGSLDINSQTISHSSQLGQLATRITLKASRNDGFDDFEGDDIDDSADTFTSRYQGLWTPTVTDTINFQIGTGDTKTTIGPTDYHERHWKNKYQHLNWKRITNDWSDFALSFYHNQIDFIDEDTPIDVEGADLLFGAKEELGGLSQHQLLFGDDGIVIPPSIQEIFDNTDPSTVIAEPAYAHFSDRWDIGLISNIYPSDNLRMSLGLSSRYDSFETELFLGGPGKVSQIKNRFNANFEWTAKDNLTINYGHVFEKIRDQIGTNSYRVAANYQYNNEQIFRLAVSKSYRDPTLLEANQNSIYTIDNNGEEIIVYTGVFSDQNISSEKLISRELGYLGSFHNKNILIDFRYFYEDFSDLIGERREDSDGPLQDIVNIIDNIERVKLRGIEWQLQYKPSNQFLLSLNNTYIENTNGYSLYRTYKPNNPAALDADCELINNDEFCGVENLIPKVMVNLLASYTLPSYSNFPNGLNAFFSGLRLSGSYHYKSSYTPRVFDEVFPPSHSRIDLMVSKRWRHADNWVELSLAAQNTGSDYPEHFSYNKFQSKYILELRVGSN